MKVRMEFVPALQPERDAVEMDQFPLTVHGCRMELVDPQGPNGWPIITIDGPEDTIRDLLRRGGVEMETVEVMS